MRAQDVEFLGNEIYFRLHVAEVVYSGENILMCNMDPVVPSVMFQVGPPAKR